MSDDADDKTILIRRRGETMYHKADNPRDALFVYQRFADAYGPENVIVERKITTYETVSPEELVKLSSEK